MPPFKDMMLAGVQQKSGNGSAVVGINPYAVLQVHEEIPLPPSKTTLASTAMPFGMHRHRLNIFLVTVLQDAQPGSDQTTAGQTTAFPTQSGHQSAASQPKPAKKEAAPKEQLDQLAVTRLIHQVR